MINDNDDNDENNSENNNDDNGYQVICFDDCFYFKMSHTLSHFSRQDFSSKRLNV